MSESVVPNKVLSIANSHSNVNLFTVENNMPGDTTVTFGQDFQAAIQKEIKKFLKDGIEIDLFRWKDGNETITVQISSNGRILSEKTFQLT